MDKATLYSRAVKVSEEYLGPAGERFLRRQIDTHLGIEPEELTKKDIPKLIKWTELAFAMLTNDQFEVNAFKDNLLSLGAQNSAAHEKAR